MKLKTYRILVYVVMTLLACLSIYLIVRTSMLFAVEGTNIADNVIFIICLVFVLVLEVMNILNTRTSIKRGSTFVRPLVYDDDDTYNNKFIIFCYVFGVISLGVLIYFILLVTGVAPKNFNFPIPLYYLILNVFALTLAICVLVPLFKLTGKQDPSFKHKK